MRDISSYLSWLPPVVQSSPEWTALIKAISEELVDLGRRQMGTSDDRGFSKTNLIPNGDFSTDESWRTFAEAYSPHGPNVRGGDWQIKTDDNIARIPVGSERTQSWLIRYIPQIFKDQYYRLKYEVLESSGTELELHVGPTPVTEFVEIPSEVGEHEVVIYLSDYYLQLRATYSSDATIEITDLSLVEEYASESEERISLIRRVMDIDNAPRWILERAQRSLGLPWFEDLPEELLRRFIRYAITFYALSGSSSGSSLLFYLFGFRVRFVQLYARKDDYEAETFPWLPQQLFLFDLKVATESSAASHALHFGPAHQLLVGDLLWNDTNPWENINRRIVSVTDEAVYLDYPANTYAGDVIIMAREPSYPINPDPLNYFAIPWLDVYIKSDLLTEFDIPYSRLKELLEETLPANVCVRNIGYDTGTTHHSFQMSQVMFRQKFRSIYGVAVTEVSFPPSDGTTPADNTEIHVVSDPVPVTGVDINGTPCDRYSYAVTSLSPLTYVIINDETADPVLGDYLLGLTLDFGSSPVPSGGGLELWGPYAHAYQVPVDHPLALADITLTTSGEHPLATGFYYLNWKYVVFYEVVTAVPSGSTIQINHTYPVVLAAEYIVPEMPG